MDLGSNNIYISNLILYFFVDNLWYICSDVVKIVLD